MQFEKTVNYQLLSLSSFFFSLIFLRDSFTILWIYFLIVVNLKIMSFFIGAPPLTPVIKTAAVTDIARLNTIFAPLHVLLTPLQEAGMVKVGTVRGAEINAIKSRLIDAYPSVLPETCTAIALLALMQEEKDTASLIAMIMAIVGGLETHLKIVQNDVKFVCSQSFDNAKNLGKTVPTVKVVVDEISAEFHGRVNAKKVAAAYDIAPSATIAIVGVITDSIFTNVGLTVLAILNENGLIADTINVHPGTGVHIPTRWTKITVANLSATAQGHFCVFMQA